MTYRDVCLESLGYQLPDTVVTSAAIERRLQPTYRRLGLNEGQLELLTGIRQRRQWDDPVRPSEVSARSVRQALAVAGIPPGDVGALVHASLWRDYLEPATAAVVHRRLGLGPDCLIYDVSNACLGFMSGMVQVANLIEQRQIEVGVVVGTENCKPLLDETIRRLNADEQLSHEQFWPQFGSLTIGSGSVAVVLAHAGRSRSGNRLGASAWRCDTSAVELCTIRDDQPAGPGLRPLAQTHSEQLLEAGVCLAREIFAAFCQRARWQARDVDVVIPHQVGAAYQRRIAEIFQVPQARCPSTVETLANTCSVALPLTMALESAGGRLRPGDKIVLFGFGSGVVATMLGVTWQTSLERAGCDVPVADALDREAGQSAAEPNHPDRHRHQETPRAAAASPDLPSRTKTETALR